MTAINQYGGQQQGGANRVDDDAVDAVGLIIADVVDCDDVTMACEVSMLGVEMAVVIVGINGGIGMDDGMVGYIDDVL